MAQRGPGDRPDIGDGRRGGNLPAGPRRAGRPPDRRGLPRHGLQPAAAPGVSRHRGPGTPEWRLRADGEPDKSTRVRFALELRPTGVMRVMTPMITRQMRREVAQLDSLKAILEAAPR